MKYLKLNNNKKASVKIIALGCLLLAFLFAGAGRAMAATDKYIGYWKASGGSNKVLQFDTWEEFVETWRDFSGKNLKLQDLEIIKVGNEFKYTGAWVAGTGKSALYAYDNWTDFAAKWKEMLDDKSLQLIDIEVVPVGNKIFYIGVWDANKGGSALLQYDNWESFVAKWGELSKENRVLIDVEAFRYDGKIFYVGVWQTGSGKDQALYQTTTWKEFGVKLNELGDKGLRLVDVNILQTGGGEMFIGVMNKGTHGDFVWLMDSWSGLQAKNKEQNGKKLDLVHLAAVEYPVPPKPTPKPDGKPAQKGVLYFSLNQPMKKDAVTGIDFPADMPAIVYPTFDGCNAADRKVIEKAWAYAHHHAWRAYQLFQYFDKTSTRDDLWSSGYTAGSDLKLRKASWSPYAWFGEYSGSTYRYDFIRDAIYMNWQKRFLVKNTVKCRRNDGGLHPCYVENPGTDRTPSANHIVSGTINFCNRFFDGTTEANDDNRVRIVLHEMFHWLAPRGLAILDTQTHSDMKKFGCGTDTDKMYGEDDALHLATSTGCWGNPKYHRGMAARNNDNYAYFILRFGSAVYDKRLTRFPQK